MDALDQDLERFRARFATNLDGRWGVLLEHDDPQSPAYAVWLFHGDRGSREATRQSESFTCQFPRPFVVVIQWSSGDEEELAYEFEIVNAGTRRLALMTQGRSTFSTELGPLTLIGYH